MSDAPESSVDPFDEAVLADPYPMHEQLRELGPVVRLSAYGIWAMARYEQVHTALVDHDTFCSSAGVGLSDFRKETPWRPPSLLLEADPPAHARARRPVNRAMSPGTVRRSLDPLATEATELFDRLAGRDEIDGIGDVAIPYPLTVFPDIVGLPAEGRPHLLPYGEMVFNGFGPRNRLFTEAMAGAAPVQEWVARMCRAEHLAPGGMGAHLHAYAAEDGFTPDQSALLMRSLLSAGLDTTVHAIGNALWCLAANPDQYALLRADPSRAGAAFEEALRYESAVQTFFRTTTRAVVVGTSRSRPARRCCCSSVPPTGTTAAGRSRTGSTSPARPAGTSPSAPGSMPASAVRWPGPRAAPCSPSWPAGTRRSRRRVHRSRSSTTP